MFVYAFHPDVVSAVAVGDGDAVGVGDGDAVGDTAGSPVGVAGVRQNHADAPPAIIRMATSAIQSVFLDVAGFEKGADGGVTGAT